MCFKKFGIVIIIYVEYNDLLGKKYIVMQINITYDLGGHL